jgi:acyl-CoA thioesterase-1
MPGSAHRAIMTLLELGANDLLRQIPPVRTRTNLDAVLDQFDGREIPALLATFDPPAFLAQVARGYSSIYADLARQHGVATCPFFPPGMLGHPQLVPPDRIHPHACAIDMIAQAMVPAVISALEAPITALPDAIQAGNWRFGTSLSPTLLRLPSVRRPAGAHKIV